VALDKPCPRGTKDADAEAEEAGRRAGDGVGASALSQREDKWEAQQAIVQSGQDGGGEKAAGARERKDAAIRGGAWYRAALVGA
jgi:hypothetical protein